MNNGGSPSKRHLSVDRFHHSSPYKSPKRAFPAPVPIRPDPRSHGRELTEQVSRIQQEYSTLAQSWVDREDIRARGIIIELESAPEIELSTDRFEKDGLELLNERDERNDQGQMVQRQTWFVPDGKLAVLAKILNEYLTKTRKIKNKDERQPYNRGLVEAIEKITQAAVNQLWTEIDEPFPTQSTIWFEIWLRAGANPDEREVIRSQFQSLCVQFELRVGEGRIDLPEHTIVAVFGKGENFTRDLALMSCMAEIRRGREYSDFFTNLTTEDQAQFADELGSRVELADANAPYIGILDTGINRGHPLLEPLISESNNQTIKSAWGAADDDDHGTRMAGLCLFGNLADVLGGSGTVKLPVHIEGVKIVPPPDQRGNDEKLAGYYTAQGIAIAESSATTRMRVWCLATTMKGPNNPRPTSWSSGLDALACGRDNNGQVHRLFCLSSGNVPQSKWGQYPESNFDHNVENPGQAWNVLCVGSYTNFAIIRPPNSTSSPIASIGGMAPTNSTSRTWENIWPNKPDVVFEGGNAAQNTASNSTFELPELMLLSTTADFLNGAFEAMCGTSPATALAARMAGQIMAEYPELWPETVRGLIVHSASWTTAMLEACPSELTTEKRKFGFLLRTVGYGVPNLQYARGCIASRVTMLAQCELQPFRIERNQIISNEMHVHALPWPTIALTANSDRRVRLKVTLSYFVEPNPGSRGYSTTYRYAGCQLRFRVSSPGQTEADLKAQVSKISAVEMRDTESREYVRGIRNGWALGDQSQRGSVHSDYWEGNAADLLSMKYIAVFPLTGWWRTRAKQHRANARVKYGLILTLEDIGQEIDLYTEIASQITLPIEIAAT